MSTRVGQPRAEVDRPVVLLTAALVAAGPLWLVPGCSMDAGGRLRWPGAVAAGGHQGGPQVPAAATADLERRGFE
jgi:hypothetical protein